MEKNPYFSPRLRDKSGRKPGNEATYIPPPTYFGQHSQCSHCTQLVWITNKWLQNVLTLTGLYRGVFLHILRAAPRSVGGMFLHTLSVAPCRVGGVFLHILRAAPRSVGGMFLHTLSVAPCRMGGVFLHILCAAPCWVDIAAEESLCNTFHQEQSGLIPNPWGGHENETRRNL